MDDHFRAWTGNGVVNDILIFEELFRQTVVCEFAVAQQEDRVGAQLSESKGDRLVRVSPGLELDAVHPLDTSLDVIASGGNQIGFRARFHHILCVSPVPRPQGHSLRIVIEEDDVESLRRREFKERVFQFSQRVGKLRSHADGTVDDKDKVVPASLHSEELRTRWSVTAQHTSAIGDGGTRTGQHLDEPGCRDTVRFQVG